MTRTSTTAREWKHARLLIEAFCGQFGKWAPAYRLLAQHAALPLILTPELVSYLRNHFLRGQAPWVAESDLLLSDLCREVAYEQYAMDQAVRAVLIEELRRDPALGKARMAEVARLLIGYIRSLATTDQPLPSHELQAQQWAAMVYLDDKRESVARQIATAFSGVLGPGGVVGVDRAELARLANLTQTLAPELAAYRELVSYGRNVARLLGDVTGKAVEELDKNGRLDVEGVVLDVALPALRMLAPSRRATHEDRKAEHAAIENPPAPGQPLWRVTLPGSPALQPALAQVDGRTLLLLPWSNRDAGTGGVVALDTVDGTKAWAAPLDMPVEGGVAVAEAAGIAVIGLARRGPFSSEGALTALDLRTGKEDRWPARARTGGGVEAAPVTDGVCAYVAADDGQLYRVDLASGGVVWKKPVADKPVRTPAPAALHIERGVTRAIIVATYGVSAWQDDGRLVAFDAVGRRLWSADPSGQVRGAPVIAHGRVYVAAFRGSPAAGVLSAFDLRTGRPAWPEPFTIPAPPGGRSDLVAAPLVVGDTVYVGSHDHRLYAVDATTGKTRWTYEISRGIVTTAAWSKEEGLVVFGANDGTVYAADTVTGALVWKYEASGHVQTAIVKWDRIVFAVFDTGEVTALLCGTWARTQPSHLNAPEPRIETVSRDAHSHAHPGIINTGQSWAVLVGVDTYEDNRHLLNVCVRDAEAIRQALITGGFDPTRIRLLTDNTDEKPTRANILAALKSIADATEPDDLLLFYYSGHGDEADGESYLIPRDARLLMLNKTAIPLTQVKQIMGTASAKAKVILGDVAGNGLGLAPTTSTLTHRPRMQIEDIAMLASCQQGQQAHQYQWRDMQQSVFTHFLLEALAGNADLDGKGFVTLSDASRYVIDGVKLWAVEHNVAQNPTLEYSLAGDVLLTRYAASRQASEPGSEIGLAPHVVRTEPADGETDVNPALQKLAITFDRPMAGGSWSITTSGGLDTTGLVPEQSVDGTTFVFTSKTPISLPGNAKITYFINPSEPSGRGFVDTEGRRAETYSLRFTTGVLITSIEPMPNPYGWAAPVEGDRFVDREEILRLLEDLWKSPKDQSPILLFGQRRIGITSILAEFRRRSRDQAIVVYLDMQASGLVYSTGELIYNLARGLYDALSAVGAEQTVKEPREEDFAGGNPFTAFEWLMTQVDRKRGDRQVIIVMDEYEVIEQRIAQGRVDAEMLSYWRHLIQAYPWVTFVWAGLHTLEEMAHDYWSPLLFISKAVRVSYMSYEATRELITRPALDLRLEYSTEAVREIYALTNGHPYLTQLLCHDLVEFVNIQARRNVLRSDVNVVVNDSNRFQVGSYYFDALWRQAAGNTGSGQAEVLQAIARSETPMDLSAIARATRRSADATRGALETLERRDVLMRDETNRWRYAVELMRRWVARSDT